MEDFTADADAISEAFSAPRLRTQRADVCLTHWTAHLTCLQRNVEAILRNILIIDEAKDRGSKTKLEMFVQKLQRRPARPFVR